MRLRKGKGEDMGKCNKCAFFKISRDLGKPFAECDNARIDAFYPNARDGFPMTSWGADCSCEMFIEKSGVTMQERYGENPLFLKTIKTAEEMYKNEPEKWEYMLEHFKNQDSNCCAEIFKSKCN